MAFLSQAPRLEGLLPSHGAFQGHAAHLMRWPMRLSPNGSRGTCIPQGLVTFLHAAFTAHRWPATASAAAFSSSPSAFLTMSLDRKLSAPYRTGYETTNVCTTTH